MEDPYYRDNELKALKIMDNDFTYITRFDVPEAILGRESVLLHFDGIDTIGDVFLNGTLLGVCEEYAPHLGIPGKGTAAYCRKRTEGSARVAHPFYPGGI